MAEIVVHGIPNCDTVKRARTWLESQGVAYRFHDFRKDGITADMIKGWLQKVPRDVLINRKGTTWRKLPENVQAAAESESDAVALMLAQPSVIKRPVLAAGDALLVGFDPDRYADTLK
ncbi:MAG: ArsC family reductase [Candidatus Protistobacter heckmanni]|nr:ArsC family reductase [Candidatus Protistobacter heckmanni]